MSSKTEVQATGMDLVRWVAAGAVLLAALALFYHFADESVLYRVIGMLAAVAVALGIVWTTAMGQVTRGFLGDARTEVRKVVWPTRQETLQLTISVLVMVLIMGIALWLLDMFLLWAVELATGQARG
ncbi:MAG: preprotein translocase subunit SecE [Gammaproteobacteria bacterium]